MASPTRPVTGPDHVPKEVFIHAGLVFAGHLDVTRLQEAASKIIDAYPELNVTPKRLWLSFGKWWCAPATQPAWDFKHRELPDKTLADIFPPAAATARVDFSTSKITPLGTAEVLDSQDAFGFDGPSIGRLGWSHVAALTFRVTLLGDSSTGHTLVGLIVPHILMDATGLSAVMETLGKLYRGEKVAPRAGDDPHPDLLDILGPVAEQDIKDDERPGRGFQYSLSKFFSYLQFTRQITAKGVTESYVHFPAALLERLRDEARGTLTGEDVGLRVSRFDVFCAMMIKLFIHSASTMEPDNPFDFYNVYHQAGVFPKDSLPRPYLHNLNVAGWFPMPSSSQLANISLSEIAVLVRKRLNALRTPFNVREQIKHANTHAGTIIQSPCVDVTHGWGMVSSWKELEEATRKAFPEDELIFMRSAIRTPMDLLMPNLSFPFGDGKGGLYVRMSTTKGDWDSMWEKSGLGGLK